MSITRRNDGIQRRRRPRRPLRTWQWRNVMGLALLSIVALGSTACEQEQRFKIPASYRRMKLRAKEVYKPQGKVKIPRSRTLPLWSEMVDMTANSVFRSEVVTLQGVRWSRESSSKIYDFYFRSENHMAARTLAQISNHIAFFVSRWFGRPFPGRIPVVLMPSSARPKAPKPRTKKKPIPTKKVVRPTTRRAAPIARAASQPASRPTATTKPTTQPTAARPAPTKPVAARPVAPPTPGKPTAPAVVKTPKVTKTPGLLEPDVGPRRIVIYTGTTNNPVFSRYGLISELLSHTVRVFMTRRYKRDGRLFWRSVVIPAYFALRGTGAMVDTSYDKTATPTLRNILRRLGRPSIEEVQRSLQTYRKGQLPKALHNQAEHLAMSMLGFIEDAYGRGVLAAVLRDQLGAKQVDLSQSAAKVIGRSWGALWQQWLHYYYKDLWRDVLRGRVPQKALPLPADPRAVAPRPTPRR